MPVALDLTRNGGHGAHPGHLHLAVALDGAGWHPAAWREPDAQPQRLFTATTAGLADLLQDWQSVGLSGFRLRPAALPHDLKYVTERLVPELQRRGLFRTRYEADTLRGLLGLGRPANRYAAA